MVLTVVIIIFFAAYSSDVNVLSMYMHADARTRTSKLVRHVTGKVKNISGKRPGRLLQPRCTSLVSGHGLRLARTDTHRFLPLCKPSSVKILSACEKSVAMSKNREGTPPNLRKKALAHTSPAFQTTSGPAATARHDAGSIIDAPVRITACSTRSPYARILQC